MAGYVLHLTEEENITLSAAVVRRLIEGGDGDAALLYLCIVRSRGSSTSEKLREELHWGDEQMRRAESALHRMGLVALPGRESAPAEPPPPPAEPATPDYSREDVMQKLESDAAFSQLLREVERKLGRLTDPSVKKLLGLY
ncbi:MAG: DNA replication protein DnaD, partial [Oscillospiraceae bacterium]|nr:DNA replication protein DnaD [Oscillospiraceae bacterium]